MNKNDPTSETKFKEVQEAYDALTDTKSARRTISLAMPGWTRQLPRGRRLRRRPRVTARAGFAIPRRRRAGRRSILAMWIYPIFLNSSAARDGGAVVEAAGAVAGLIFLTKAPPGRISGTK